MTTPQRIEQAKHRKGENHQLYTFGESELHALLLQIQDEQKEIIEAYDEYIELLVDELNEVTQIATIHGWKSRRFESGERARNKIEQAKNNAYNPKDKV